jgi:hypothetical protein
MTSPDLPPNLPYSPVGTPPPKPRGAHHKTPAHTSPGEVAGNPGDPPNGLPPLSSLSKERGGRPGAPQTRQNGHPSVTLINLNPTLLRNCEQHITQTKTQLQNTNPHTHPTEYRQQFTDLIDLETHRKKLLQHQRQRILVATSAAELWRRHYGADPPHTVTSEGT